MISFDADFHHLSWDADMYQAVTGPWGLGPLPRGEYTIKVHDVVENSLNPGLIDPITKKSWFIPIVANFQTKRNSLGIHPDGNVPGTEGCIGLQGADAARFYKKWISVPIGVRPTTLTVT
jgi:hypothetical protein